MDLFCTRLLYLCAFWFTSKCAFTTESALLNNTEPFSGGSCSECDLSSPRLLYCKNGGTCHCLTVGINVNAVCECMPSYTGQFCEETVNEIMDVSTVSTVSDEGIITFEMATQPTTSVQPDICVNICNLYMVHCLNGGSCRCPPGAITIPTCECPPSHEGPRCEKIAESSLTVPVTKDHTSDEPTAVMATTAKTSQSCPINVCVLFGHRCKNGATCVRNCDGFTNVTCNCVYPYTGTTCSDTHEAATTESLGNSQCGLLMPICKHGEVKCANGTLLGERCICHGNWTGEFCDQQCEKDCSHHGYCVPRNDVNQMESCACWRNYTGDFCETFSPLLDAPTPTWLISMLLVLVMLCVAVLMIAVACVMYKKRRQKRRNISLRV